MYFHVCRSWENNNRKNENAMALIKASPQMCPCSLCILHVAAPLLKMSSSIKTVLDKTLYTVH